MPIAFLQNMLDSDSEEDEDEDEDFVRALYIIAPEELNQIRRNRRSQTRLYLTRSELLLHPRGRTPWQVLYHSNNDRAFITTMGLDMQTFHLLLESGFQDAWETRPIPRADANFRGRPRLQARSLDAAGALGLILHYLTSAIPETALQQIFAVIPSTVSRYIDFGLLILLGTLRSIPAAAIRWPEGQDFRDLNDLITQRHPLLGGEGGGAFCSMDGLKLAVQVSGNADVENATYNGWLHGHFTSCIFVLSPLGV
jgi:hypothetical protein